MNKALTILTFLTLSLATSRAQAAPPVVTPPPQLTAEDALAGWIALFDGQTTFGWHDAKLLSSGKQVALQGGATTTEFSDYELRIKATTPGTVTLSGQRHEVKSGWNTVTSRGVRGPVALSSELAVEALLLKPLELKSLFNGKNLANWDRRYYGHSTSKRPAEWTVEEGVIRARGGPGALEYAPREGQYLFGDFIVQVVVRTRADNTNGGLFVRNEPGKTMMGYEAQLHNTWYDQAKGDRGCTTGAIDDRQQARAPVAVDYRPFCMTVVAHGPHLATWVNGYQQTDWIDTREPHPNPRNGKRIEPGTLQLQAHDPETDIEFHGVYMQEMPKP